MGWVPNTDPPSTVSRSFLGTESGKNHGMEVSGGGQADPEMQGGVPVNSKNPSLEGR